MTDRDIVDRWPCLGQVVHHEIAAALGPDDSANLARLRACLLTASFWR
jgi:hypothetical protein